MSHFYFHFTMDGEYFPDLVGQDFDDLARSAFSRNRAWQVA